MIGALVLTVVGIVISAAFAVGARRQLVTIGQLSASGASPTTVRTALVLQGTVTGLVGAVAGLGLAAVLLGLGAPPAWSSALDQRIDALRRSGGRELVAVISIGVVAATVAALIPARYGRRVPHARRPGRPPPAGARVRAASSRGAWPAAGRARAALRRRRRRPAARRAICGRRRDRRWRGRAARQRARSPRSSSRGWSPSPPGSAAPCGSAPAAWPATAPGPVP